MTPKIFRTEVTDLDMLEAGHFVVAYQSEADFHANDPKLSGIMELSSPTPSGGWDVEHQLSGKKATASDSTNFTDDYLVFRIMSDNPKIGYSGPWTDQR